MNRPYVNPSMLVCKKHPELGLWCREDGCVFIPDNRARKAHWTYGSKNNKGYLMVKYRGKNYSVHRLIARTFLGEPPLSLPTVDHINRVKTANFVANLRYCSFKTQADNTANVINRRDYGVRKCDDSTAYNRAYYANNAEQQRARCRERYAADSEHKLAMGRVYRAKQYALGKRYRRCPDGKQHWLTDEEYGARFGNESRQMQLF